MTITEFLLARIAEDEATALACDVPRDGGYDLDWRMEGTTVYPLYQQTDGSPNEGNYIPSAHAQHIIRHDPSRVLAECAAKRAIAQIHLGDGYGEYCRTCTEDHGGILNPCPTIAHLAAIYADHPDYPALENVGVLPE